jgi:internalin A
MHGTHQFFLTERSLYVLVLAGREDREDEDAEYWLKMICAFGGDSPVIIVLNKIKEHRFDLNEEALREKYPNIRAFVETDCKLNRGIRKLRRVVTDEINRMDSIRAAFPSQWFEIKARLSDMPENFMPFERFREICCEHGEGRGKAQDELARFLHILGIALNYRDDPRLCETSVLNPKWVTTGIYKLLNDESIRRRRGLLRVTDLARVLPETDYPVSMHGFLLDLMKKFELCFPLDDEGREHLIPELLGKKQPPLGEEFDMEKCLCFEYRYDSLLPEGLLPRFIVRAYTRIERDLRWRSGVVLGWKKARALIKADEADRQVLIRVHGTLDARRELLSLIRQHFDAIHRNFRKLDPVEMIRLPQDPTVVLNYAKVEAFATHRHGPLSEYWAGAVWTLDAAELLAHFELPGAESDPRKRGAGLINQDRFGLSVVTKRQVR